MSRSTPAIRLWPPSLNKRSTGYILNKVAAWDVGGHFLALSFLLLFRLVRRRDWWGLCLPIGTFCKLKLTYVSASYTTATYHWLQATVSASSSELFSTKTQRVWASSLQCKFSQSLRLQRSWPSTTSYTEGSYATALGTSLALSALVLLLECSSTAIWLHSRFR